MQLKESDLRKIIRKELLKEDDRWAADTGRPKLDILKEKIEELIEYYTNDETESEEARLVENQFLRSLSELLWIIK